MNQRVLCLSEGADAQGGIFGISGLQNRSRRELWRELVEIALQLLLLHLQLFFLFAIERRQVNTDTLQKFLAACVPALLELLCAIEQRLSVDHVLFEFLEARVVNLTKVVVERIGEWHGGGSMHAGIGWIKPYRARE